MQVSPDEERTTTDDTWLILDAHVEAGDSPVCRLYSGLALEEQRWFRVRAYNLAGHGYWPTPYHYQHGFSVVPSLSTRVSVERQAALMVSDARTREGETAVLAFEVMLGEAASGPLTHL